MRVLSDFDGVWTDATREALWIRDDFARRAAELMGVSRDRASEEAEAFLAAARAEPAINGWCPRGHLAAFVDEDPAVATGSIAHWLDARRDEGSALHDVAERWRRGLAEAGFVTVEAFGFDHFPTAMRRFRDEQGHSLVPGAADRVRAFASRGHELVVVSNSPREKLVRMFADAGVAESDSVRFVGDARKWWIGDPTVTLEIGSRTVLVDRPDYRAIVERVQPDVVIGDVPSLDLAVLPEVRSRSGESDRPAAVLHRHEHTPSWALEQPALPRGERLVDAVVDRVEDVLTRSGRDH